MNNEQLTITMPFKEYERLKDFEKVVNEYKKESCFIYQFDGKYRSSIDVINPELMDSILSGKIIKMEDEIQSLQKALYQIKPPSLWQLLEKKLSL